MNLQNPRQLKLLTLLGLVCLAFPYLSLYYWLQAFNAGNSQDERIQLFLEYSPSFLRLGGIGFAELFFCVVAGVLSCISLKLQGITWKIISLLILIASVFRFL